MSSPAHEAPPRPIGLRFTAQPDGRVTDPSPGWLTLAERAEGGAGNLSPLSVASREALSALFAHPQAFTLEVALLPDAHGAVRHLQCASFWDAERAVHRCRLADITDLVEARQQAAHGRDILMQMIDHLPLLMMEFDAGTHLPCTFAGGTLLPLVLSTPGEPIGRDLAALFDPALAVYLQERVAESTREGVADVVWRIRDAEGAWRVLDGRLGTRRDLDGRPVSHLLDVLDTTAYHDTMAALQAGEERLRRFVTASSDGIVVHMDQQILDANPAACRLLGTTADALRLQRFEDLIAPADRPAYQAVAQAASHEAHQCRLIHRQGGSVAVEIIGRSMERQGRRMQMAILRDVSDRVEAQQRIRQLIDDLSAQRDRAEAADRAKSLFLSAASHDLRQPIHALALRLASLEAIASSTVLPLDILADVVQRMGESLDVLGRLLNALLDVSRLDANAVVVQPAAFNLDDLLEDMETDLMAVALDKNLRLVVVRSGLWVHTDPTVLRRVLDNLVSNAIRYTARGRVLVGARPRGGSVEIQVWDSGIGIPHDQLDAIFGEFYQIQAAASPDGRLRGLGLGLAIVKRSADLLGAAIRVRSHPGKGSMFSITVQGAQPTQAPPDTAHAPPVAPAIDRTALLTRHVLVIDDDPLVLQAMAQLLQAWGHEVWCASNADEAVVLAISHAERIDLVLSDYHLGADADATQFIGTVRSLLAPNVPACVLTADTSTGVLRQIEGMGLRMLHKPVHHDALRQLLEQSA